MFSGRLLDGGQRGHGAGRGPAGWRPRSTSTPLPDKGTALLARVGKAPATTGGMAAGGVSRAHPGRVGLRRRFRGCRFPGGRRVLVVDGLGTRTVAADCAIAAMARSARARQAIAPPDLMQEVHGALRATRGRRSRSDRRTGPAANSGTAGIGNIAGASCWENGAVATLISHPGIVGHDVRNVRELTYPLGKNGLLLLCSDGISTHWSLEGYTGLLSAIRR